MVLRCKPLGMLGGTAPYANFLEAADLRKRREAIKILEKMSQEDMANLARDLYSSMSEGF